ncbi:hypothetical protein V9K81_08710 [Pseudomonas monteilii]|uniref:hypothetical protein n=1 Tax=Pseudomonas monteilii TaxID=76759 RepID=UPI0030CF6555
MPYFLAKLLNPWFVRIQKREMKAFTDALSSMDGKEIGFLLAIATHQRNHWEDQGVLLMDPLVYYPADPTIVLRLQGVLKEYQKSKQMTDASGAMVWIHTMRVGGQHELRPYAREMWRQLGRGFPHVLESALEIMAITSMCPRTSGYDQFPKGLTPDPL